MSEEPSTWTVTLASLKHCAQRGSGEQGRVSRPVPYPEAVGMSRTRTKHRVASRRPAVWIHSRPSRAGILFNFHLKHDHVSDPFPLNQGSAAASKEEGMGILVWLALAALKWCLLLVVALLGIVKTVTWLVKAVVNLLSQGALG